MMRTALKIAGGTFFLVLLGAGLFVGLDGGEAWTSFVYSKFNPTSEQLIGDQKIPRKLSVAEWGRDLDSLAAMIRQRGTHLEAAYGSERLARRLDSLKRRLSQQTRPQRILSVARLANFPAPGTGHSGLSPTQRPLNWSLLPFRLFAFADGYYVVDAMDEDIVDHEVLALGGTPIDSVAAALAPYVSADNRWHRRAQQPLFMMFAEPLRAVGVVDQIEEIPVRMRTPQGDILTRMVEPGGVFSPSMLRYAWSLRTPVANEWSPAHLHARKALPRVLSGLDRPAVRAVQ